MAKEKIKIFHSYFCLILCASFKEQKGFAETQAVRPIIFDITFNMHS